MVDWLKDDLQNCTADWIIAFMHLGAYSKGTKNSDTDSEWIRARRDVIPLLESYGVDLVLCAHSHVYERSGLIDGLYGLSSTFNPSTMRKWLGNGSEIGGVNAAGAFETGSQAAGGAYQKPAATPRAGAVYAVVGASSSAQNWWGGSTALVNPNPHPVHVTSLLSIGSMVIDIDGNQLNGRYLGEFGALRDDFTLIKGSSYRLHPAAPTTGGGVAFPVTRSGATAFAEQVAVEAISITGNPPAQAVVEFAAGQSSALAGFFPVAGGTSARFEARILPTTRSLQPGAAARPVYRSAGDPQQGQFAVTPMGIWYASRFAAPPPPGAWDSDDDADGLNLLLEYALGGEPGQNDSKLLPGGSFENGAFVFRFTRPQGRTDLDYGILASSDLIDWSLPSPAEVNDGPASAFGEPRKVIVPSGTPVRFLKLKIQTR
jgi:hypothetical protein